jgi:hypothetical protein
MSEIYLKNTRVTNYKGFYSIGKKTHQDDGQVINEGFGLDREALEV